MESIYPNGFMQLLRIQCDILNNKSERKQKPRLTLWIDFPWNWVSPCMHIDTLEITPEMVIDWCNRLLLLFFLRRWNYLGLKYWIILLLYAATFFFFVVEEIKVGNVYFANEKRIKKKWSKWNKFKCIECKMMANYVKRNELQTMKIRQSI